MYKQSFLLPLFLWPFLMSVVCLSEEITFGATLGLTGAFSKYSTQARYGMQLAVEDINAAGGINGKPVRLVVEDFGDLDLKRAVSGIRKLISFDKAQVYFSLFIEDSEVTVPISTSAPLFSMSVGCGARKCSSNLGKYHVRAATSHDKIIETLVQYAQRENVKHACIIAAEATYFGGYGRYIEELSKRAGQQVTYVSVPYTNEDFREIAVRFKNEQCDAIYPWITFGSISSFYRRLRELGSKAILFGLVETEDPAILGVAGPASEGVVFARFKVGSDAFQQRFKQRFGEPVSRPAVPAYDGVRLVAKLISQVGTNAVALRAAINDVKAYPATNGLISFTPEGEREGEDIELMQIVNAKAVPLE